MAINFTQNILGQLVQITNNMKKVMTSCIPPSGQITFPSAGSNLKISYYKMFNIIQSHFIRVKFALKPSS